jgi:RND family efflux transporter MFP subunit
MMAHLPQSLRVGALFNLLPSAAGEEKRKRADTRIPSRLSWLSALVLVSMLGACRDDQQSAPPPIRPVLSTVAMVRTEDALGPFAGTIEARYKTDFGFRIFGRMVARFVDIGDVVKKGDDLAALDPATEVLSVRGAQASVVSAEAQSANAQAEESRQRELVGRNITPQAQFDLIVKSRDTAHANLIRAQAILRKALDTLSFTQLKADFDGVVTGRYASPGQVVTAGQKIVTIARPEVREAVIAVPSDLGDILAGKNDLDMFVTLDDTITMKASRVRGIDPDLDPTTRTRIVFLTLDDPPPAFRLGITISVRFTRPVSPRIDLPATALLDRDGRTFVWVVDPAASTVAEREVKVLSRNDDRVAISEGIAAGQRIVTVGVHSLAPGQKVKVAP